MGLVYKFSSPAGIKYILESKNLSFTSLSSLNDINEGMSDISDIVNVRGEHSIRSFYEKVKLDPTNPLSQVSYEELAEIFEKRGLTQAVFDQFEKRLAWQIMLKKYSQFGVLSLTDSPRNLLMWGHYTLEGKGLCIGFDDQSDVFADSEYGGIKGLHRVAYAVARAKMNADNLTDRLKAAVFTKSKDWEYESEIRCVRRVPDGEVRHLVPFAPESVKEIILGPRMPLETVQHCYKLRNEMYKSATIMHALPNPSRFEMDLDEELSQTSLNYLWKDEVEGATPLQL